MMRCAATCQKRQNAAGNGFLRKMVGGALLALLCILVLVSCHPSDPTRPPEDERPEEDTITLDGGFASYTIVRPESCDSNVSRVAGYLNKIISQLYTGTSIATDWDEDKTEGESAPEILIGDTNRSATAKAREAAQEKAQGAEHWFYIGQIGAKVVILGSDDEETVAGVNYYLTRYAIKATKEQILVPDQWVFTYETQRPSLVTSSTDQTDVFVAEVALNKAPYYADATGQVDATATLQQAIDDVNARGGGIVYLPAGQYLLTDSLNIPGYVSLRGDYGDPDAGKLSEGTTLVLDKKNAFRTKAGIVLSANAAISGLTFYYPDQSVESPIAYYATVELPGGKAATIRYCTFLNSYHAISGGPTSKGMVTIDHIRGTALYLGMDSEHSGDISVTTDFCLSPRYWASAGEAFHAPTEEAIRSLMKSNGSVGLRLGDCDRDTYEDITLDGFQTGIYNREMTRAGLSGSFYRLTITGADTGLELHGIDTRYGLLLANSTISATSAAIRNLPETEPTTPGNFNYVYLVHCEISGKTEGKVRVSDESGSAQASEYTRHSVTLPISAAGLWILEGEEVSTDGKRDISGALQKLLDEAASAGGGIVYLPAGVYLLEKPVSVSSGVTLMGAHPYAQTASGTFHGTVILNTWGRGLGEDAEAAITVKGEKSGVTGMVLIASENGVSATRYEVDTPAEYAYMVRCEGKQNFTAYLCMVAASRAVHFKGAENFIADRLMMTVYDNGVRMTDCRGGIVYRLHTNGTYHTIGKGASQYLGEDWLSAAELVVEILDRHIVPRLTLFVAENSTNIQLSHCFHYGANCYLQAEDSDLTIINGESARLTGLSFDLGGNNSVLVVNFMRPNRATYLNVKKGDSIYLYNMDAAGQFSESTTVER